MNAGSLRRVERLNYLLGGLLVCAGAVTQPQPIALGVAVGVLLTCVNFFLLRRLVERWTTDAARGDAGNASLLVLPKMVGLMLAVVLSLWLLPINGMAFAVGYSIFVLSIVVEVTLAAVLPAPGGDTPGAPPSASPSNDHG